MWHWDEWLLSLPFFLGIIVQVKSSMETATLTITMVDPAAALCLTPTPGGEWTCWICTEWQLSPSPTEETAVLRDLMVLRSASVTHWRTTASTTPGDTYCRHVYIFIYSLVGVQIWSSFFWSCSVSVLHRHQQLQVTNGHQYIFMSSLEGDWIHWSWSMLL